MSNVLYYSDRCGHCKKLLEMLKTQDDLLSSTRFVNVDREPVPRGVSRVPTMLLDGVGEMTGSALFSYIESKAIQSYETTQNESSSFSYLGSSGHAETLKNYTQI